MRTRPVFYRHKVCGSKQSEMRTPQQLIRGSGDWLSSDSQLFMHPYSEYIPLTYILLDNNRAPTGGMIKSLLSSIREDDYQKIWEKNRDKMIYDLYVPPDTSKIHTLSSYTDAVKKRLLFDDPLPVKECCRRFYTSSRGWAASSLFKRPLFLSQRKYEVFLHEHSAIVQTDDNTLHPHVMAVCLPENYLYLKYNLLVNNSIDFSKVIILIDRELGTSKFYNPAFKKFYREFILPKIEETCCDVWHVPIDYIREKCFMGSFQLEGKNIIEKREEISKIISGFKEFVKKDGIKVDDENEVV